jgi:hypothetical protein
VPVLATLFGCASPIHVVKPDASPTDHEPVPQVVVQFSSSFNPAEAWGVYLDGNPLLGFSPAPAPGVTSSVPIGFAQASSPQTHEVSTNATCGTFCSYNSESVKFLPPTLIYDATDLTPAGAGNLKQFVDTHEFVAGQFSRSVPITVTVIETTPSKKVLIAATAAQLASAVPGNPLTVTIPFNDTKADFWIRGNSTGLYTLRFSAPGVVPDGGSGNVTP